jgi:hypothetical protein
MESSSFELVGRKMGVVVIKSNQEWNPQLFDPSGIPNLILLESNQESRQESRIPNPNPDRNP